MVKVYTLFFKPISTYEETTKMLKKSTFEELFPNCKNSKGFTKAINKYFPKYKIIALNRLAHALGQFSHECQGFTRFEENLNYSAKGLKSTFGKYFKNKNPENYAKRPKKIANLVYASRMGNGPELSGDGFKYRGRGIIMLTGRDNYKAFSKWIKDETIMKRPKLVAETPEIAVLSAVWFWNKRKLNKLADQDNLLKITKKINGGTNGLEHRTEETERIRSILKYQKYIIFNPRK